MKKKDFQGWFCFSQKGNKSTDFPHLTACERFHEFMRVGLGEERPVLVSCWRYALPSSLLSKLLFPAPLLQLLCPALALVAEQQYPSLFSDPSL